MESQSVPNEQPLSAFAAAAASQERTMAEQTAGGSAANSNAPQRGYNLIPNLPSWQINGESSNAGSLKVQADDTRSHKVARNSKPFPSSAPASGEGAYGPISRLTGRTLAGSGMIVGDTIMRNSNAPRNAVQINMEQAAFQ